MRKRRVPYAVRHRRFWRIFFLLREPKVLAWLNLIVALALPLIVYWGAMRELRSESPSEDCGQPVEELVEELVE